MLRNAAVVLVLLWGLGVVTSHAMGGLIYVLIMIAIVLLLVRVFQKLSIHHRDRTG